MKWLVYLSIFLIFVPTPAAAQSDDNVFGYDEETLRYWQSRYEASMPVVLNTLVQHGLDPSSIDHDFGDITFELPYDAQALPPSLRNVSGEPFVYFVEPESKTIYISVTSLVFLDELSKAAAWLYTNGCSLEPIADYMAMLNFREPEDFVGGHYPSPLDAFQIPRTQFDDTAQAQSEVDKLALAFFNHARAFIIGHELGHIYHQHNGNRSVVPAQSRRNEEEADRFAAEILAKTKTIPVGMYIFFVAWANYLPNQWDYQTVEEWEAALASHTHPLTADRMQALATALASRVRSYDPANHELIRSIARDMGTVAELIADPDIQRSIVIKRATTTVDDLGSRCKARQEQTDFALYQGMYEGRMVHYSIEGSEILDVATVLYQTDAEVIGTFDFGLGPGTIRGLIEENILYFSWKWAWVGGQGIFEATEGSKFSGTWGYGSSNHNGGTWDGVRLRN